jgi:hypothetical protein
VLSTREWDGRLVPSKTGETLLTGSALAVATDVKERVERAQTGAAQTSVLWALSRLYETTQTAGQVSKGFWTKGVPMEIFVVAGAGDAYQTLSVGTNKVSYGVNDYLKTFTRFHETTGQPLSITVYDLRCPAAYKPTNPASRPEYMLIANSTMGAYYYQSPTCDDRMRGALHSFQKEAAFRAKVYSNQRIKLDWPPIPNALKVHLKRGGTLMKLPGGTGASDDAWYFDGKTQEVVMRWNKVQTWVQPGDELQITF